MKSIRAVRANCSALAKTRNVITIGNSLHRVQKALDFISVSTRPGEENGPCTETGEEAPASDKGGKKENTYLLHVVFRTLQQPPAWRHVSKLCFVRCRRWRCAAMPATALPTPVHSTSNAGATPNRPAATGHPLPARTRGAARLSRPAANAAWAPVHITIGGRRISVVTLGLGRRRLLLLRWAIDWGSPPTRGHRTFIRGPDVATAATVGTRRHGSRRFPTVPVVLLLRLLFSMAGVLSGVRRRVWVVVGWRVWRFLLLLLGRSTL